MTITSQDEPAPADGRTASHYEKQWGKDINFQAFVEQNPEAAQVMPGRQLGWGDLFERIRNEAAIRQVRVYDAGCGFGDIARRLLADPIPEHLDYLGADIHGSLGNIDAPAQAKFVQWDMSQRLPGDRSFDFIICRAALHHTPDPEAAYAALASQLAPGGTLAISVYARKAPMREAVDDAMRAKIVPMSNEEALATASQFTQLGRDLQASEGNIAIAEDLPFLGIKAGTYSIQAFIYDHFIKCWSNPGFPAKYGDVVNFDWYHPPFAYRYSMDDALNFARSNGLSVAKSMSITSQHYVEAVSSR